MIEIDVAVIGGGMAGASLAAEIAAHRSVIVIEAEAQAGYHATGRSAAFWTETYGGPGIQPLTSASGGFLAQPPRSFSDRSFLKARGALHLARADAIDGIAPFASAFAGSSVVLEILEAEALVRRVPGLRPRWSQGLAEPSCADIDVAALHEAYLRALRRAGGRLLTGAPVSAIARAGTGWRVSAGSETIRCAVLVNAAGAWADPLAVLAGAHPLGIRPYRRTIAQLRVSPPAPVDLPLVIDIAGSFYFKGEAGGRIWLSPHDETPCQPGDAAADEEDVATAIARLQDVVDWRVDRVERRWAGLRSFAPDRLPVYGYDERCENFFWFAGQGGFGIQTAPAAAKLAAGLLLRSEPDPLVGGISPRAYAPGRF